MKDYDCYECGDPADYIDVRTSYMYCLPCIRVMFPQKGANDDE